MSDQNMVLVEHWYDSVQRNLDLRNVHSIAPKLDDQPYHCHVGFGRAEAWTVTFKDNTSIDINGCPPALERFQPKP